MRRTRALSGMGRVIAPFDTIFQRVAGIADASVELLLREIHDAYSADPADPPRARLALVELFSYLASVPGRTAANCSAAHQFLMEDPTLTKGTGLSWEFIEFVISADRLHEALDSPEITESNESTPERLLERARRLGIVDSHD